jgi:hypothetical protein
MYLYYDRLSNMVTLDLGDEGVVFLGPLTNALVNLRNYGFTDSQAREAILQAVFNMGDAVDLMTIRKIANESRFYQRSVA